jgi:hypothetical protein
MQSVQSHVVCRLELARLPPAVAAPPSHGERKHGAAKRAAAAGAKAAGGSQLPAARSSVTGLALQLLDSPERQAAELHQYAWMEGMVVQAELEGGPVGDVGALAVCAALAADLGALLAG